VGYWIGQPTLSVRYWIGQPAVSTSGFAWWSKNVDWPGEVLQHRLGGLAGERLFPLWRFLLSIGVAVLFICIAALVIAWLPDWRARRVLEKGTPAEATVVRVDRTGEQRQVPGRAGVERQLACEVEVCPEGGVPYRARTTQFFTRSAQSALRPGAGIVVRYDPAQPKRVAIVEPVTMQRSSRGWVAMR
jgi:hypothetical protein